MSDRPSTKRISVDSTVAPLGERDLAKLLRDRPELVGHRSAFLNLVQADYWRCCRSGGPLSAATYCERLPITDQGLLLSVHRLVEVERYFLENPDLLSLTGEPEWPNEGETFVSFLLEEEIGRGAASRVYRARQLDLGDRLVVLKVTTYAKTETTVMGRSDHPGIVPVYSTGVEPLSGLHWVCMPYLGERTLQSELDRNTGTLGKPMGVGLPSEQSLAIALGVAEALDYLHERGVRHGDLKPSNVLLCEDGRPMLIDFNLSQFDSAENALVGGTLPYMAPEVLRLFTTDGDPSKKSSIAAEQAIGADVFAFGCTLYQMLTGRPFIQVGEAGADARIIAVRLLEAQAEGVNRLTADLKGVTPVLAQIAAECLSLNPRHRPQSLRPVVEQLKQTTKTPKRSLSRPLIALGTALVVATVTLVSMATPSSPAMRLESARQLLRSNESSEAQSILRKIATDAEFGADARRLLGESLLDDGDYSQAVDALGSLAVESQQPSTYALAGFAAHLLHQDQLAGDYDQGAIMRGYRTASVLNNYGAGLFRGLVGGYRESDSAEITQALSEAHRLSPANESIRVNALKHIEFLSTEGIQHHYSVPDLLQPPIENPSTDYLRLACRYLPTDEVSDDELTTVGLPLLFALREEFDDSKVTILVSKKGLSRYQQLPGYASDEDPSPKWRKWRPTPPVFLDPRHDK